MNVEDITNDEIAGDIMYGNSPRDMMNRGFANEKLMQAFAKLKILVYAPSYVEDQFKNFLEKETDFYSIGKYVAFLTVLYLLSKEKAFAMIHSINQEVHPDNMLAMINQEFLKR